MRIEQVRACLQRFTYKPGWQFDLREPVAPDWQFWHFDVAFDLPDCNNPGQAAHINMWRQLNVGELCDENHFWEWLFATIKICEDHETREWFRVDGNKRDDPHADDDALERLALWSPTGAPL
jgi:hypothetical protein